ncbi:MAG: hypothetical protein ACKVJE_17265 [Pseudomonadales bacterium]
MANHDFPKTVKCGRCGGKGFVSGLMHSAVPCPECLGSGRLLEEGLEVLPDSLAIQLLRASLNISHHKYKVVKKDFDAYQVRFPDPDAGNPYTGSGVLKGD